jgi:hypothetical protein
MLKNSSHQYTLVAHENFLGTVTVMHVEIDDRHTRKTPRLKRMSSGHSNVIEKAEAHRLCALGVMTWRADCTECILHISTHHQIGGKATRTGGTQGRLQGARRHCRIGIKMYDTACRTGAVHAIDVIARMDTQQLLHISQRRIVELKIDIQPGSNQAVINGPKPIRAFRMVGAHVVLPAVAVGNEGGSCHNGYLA